MLIVLLSGVHLGFWSHSGPIGTIEASFRVAFKEKKAFPSS